jgi:uncharacterized protein
LNLHNDHLLLIFVRNPEPGLCKTRLAATIGDNAALEIYKFLLLHTASITRDLEVHKRVYYSDEIWVNDYWDDATYEKMLQQGNDLGARMQNAFDKGFEDGYTSIIIIGSDMLDLTQTDLETAFTRLGDADYVMGPASDGGYYLLGMNKATPRIFRKKHWGTSSVQDETLADLNDSNLALLPVKNDIDTYEDIKNEPILRTFLNRL